MDAANAAYAQAVELPGYKHGDFTKVWFQLELNCRRRFKKGAVPAPITVMALSKLPGEERLEFYDGGPPVPTAIVRTMAAPREARTLGIKLGAALSIAKKGSDRYYPCRPNGENISDIRAYAKVCLGMTLEAAGFLPDFQAPECNQVQVPPIRPKGPATRRRRNSWPTSSLTASMAKQRAGPTPPPPDHRNCSGQEQHSSLPQGGAKPPRSGTS